MKGIIKSLIATSILITGSIHASEVGISYNQHKDGSGMEYYGKMDVGSGINVNAGFSKINLDRTMLSYFNDDNQMEFFEGSPDVTYVNFGLGYEYEIINNLNVLASISMLKYEMSDVEISREETTEETTEENTEENTDEEQPADETSDEQKEVTTTEIEYIDFPELNAVEMKLGLSYKFADKFEATVSGIRYDRDEDFEDLNAIEGVFSYYVTDNLKINLKYQDKDILQEENLYKLGVSYKF